MPIRRELRDLYTWPDWRGRIAPLALIWKHMVRLRAGIVLTAHLDHDPTNSGH